MGAGILNSPPKKTAAQIAAGRQKTIARREQLKKEAAPQGLKGLTKGQNANINQAQGFDNRLGEVAGQQFDRINQNFQQPFDYSQLPSAPVTGDYNNWVNSQMQNYNNAFDQRMNPVFKQQNEDFEQQMANRGIPMGSELYNQEKNRMAQSQNDARTQAYASGQGQAIQGAQGLFNVGTQARGNALNEAMQQRYQPLADYNALMGARSGMDEQNLGFSQQMQLQNNAARLAKQNGGGGGPTPSWTQQGFGSFAEQAAFNDARQRDMMQFESSLNRANQPKQPSYGAQLGGGILGSVLGGWAQSGFKGIF